MTGRKIWSVAVFALLLLASQSTLHAQGNTATLVGSTVDEQHLRLPGVALLLQDTQGGLKRNLTSASDGSFVFTALPPGEYKLSAAVSGFQPAELHVTLEVNEQTHFDVVLSVAAQASSVQVSEAMPLLHPNEAAVGGPIRKDHTFLFTAKEGFQLVQGQS